MKIKSLGMLLPILLTACTTTATPPIKFSNISIPLLNTDSTAYLGDKLITQATGYYADSITLGAMDAYATDIQGGVFYNVPNTIIYKSNESDTVTLNNGFGTPLSKQNWVRFYKESNEICPNRGNCYDSSEISIELGSKQLVVKENSFQQIIEYNGKSGDILKFTYREFSNNMARQAYNTDFTMDLNDGDTIGYKGALIKVIKANNNKIEYSVIRNFNK